MAIRKCEICGGNDWKRTSIDSTGELKVCGCGHWNFDPTSTSGGSVNYGDVTVNGVCAIGDGAIAIGQVNGRRRGRR